MRIDWENPPRMAAPQHPDEGFRTPETADWSWTEVLEMAAALLLVLSVIVLVAFSASILR